MKLHSILLFLLLSCVGLNAQFEDIKDHYFSIGAGYALLDADFIFEAYTEANNFQASNTGPFHFQYEAIFEEKIGFGLELAYSKAEASWDDVGSGDNGLFYNVSRRKLSGMARVNYHLGLGKTVDPYGSFGVGYKLVHWDLDTTDPYFGDGDFIGFNNVALLLRLGIRFMFIENVGAFIEGGAGHGIVVGGLTIKI